MRLVPLWLVSAFAAPGEGGGMEKIVGPIHGFYIASYALSAPDASRFASYAKICRHQPTTYWDAQCTFKLFGGDQHTTPAAALAAAIRVAREQIDDLPSLECSTFGLDLPYFEAPSAVPA